MRGKLVQRRLAADDLAATGGSEPGQDPDALLILACDYHVQHGRRSSGEHVHAQRAHRDPGAGRKLEILAQPAVELDALSRMRHISKTNRISRPVEPIL